MRKCLECKADISKRHKNAKRCEPCATILRENPVGRLTLQQERMVRKLAGTMFIKDLAKKVGASDSTLDRWSKANGVSINALRYTDEEIAKVCEFYAKHGKVKTQKKFPNIKVRSIVDRYFKTLGMPPRCIPWTDEQLVQLARFGGLTSLEETAAYFNRPRAFRGSIVSVWQKRFGHGCMYLNGAPYSWGRFLVAGDCPCYGTAFSTRKQGPVKIFLWIDIEKHLRPEIPEHLASAIKAMAKFQKWLHGKNYRENIMRILRGI